MYIDPSHPSVGSLYGSSMPGASVENLLGLPEKPEKPANIGGMSPQQLPQQQYSAAAPSNQNGGTPSSAAYMVSRVTSTLQL